MLLGNEKLQQDLQDGEHFQEALQKMEMPHSSRGELLNLLTRVERLQARAAAGTSAPAEMHGSPHALAIAQDDKYEKMQLETFDHIRTSFWVALIMSIALFLVGLMLMGLSVFRAMREISVSTSTLTIAGLGLADFVLLFFRRPWQDVSVNLSNSQQVRTVATSYLAGLALLQRGDTNSLELLNELTKGSVEMLEQYTKERDLNHKATSKATES
jgi:hypothetical protein